MLKNYLPTNQILIFMNKKLLLLVFSAISVVSWSQNTSHVTPSPKSATDVIVSNKADIRFPKLYVIDENQVAQILSTAPDLFSGVKSTSLLTLPDAKGVMQVFEMYVASNMERELQERYSEIKSYRGTSKSNSGEVLYLSLSPLGLQTMVLSEDRKATFIEPYTKNRSQYIVYEKSENLFTEGSFACRVRDDAKSLSEKPTQQAAFRPNADDGTFRTYRLAMSVTGEYTAYFGGTKALALAAINATMTRVNGVFEKDFGVRMNLIANTDLVIYTSASTDPYSAAAAGAGGAWNQELQTTLTNVIGSANYDVGHLFGASGGGGNAGCIGCVCRNPTTAQPLGKGSGYTSPADGIPQGDAFDIDYVAHELGHQFGANHTFTHSNEGTGAQMEPGSGSTIMGYAGITGPTTDVQTNSDPYFHAQSIQQITNYIKTTTCQTNTTTGNAIPVVNAGLDYTIPRGTPFMLTGTATDANSASLNYCWEQMNVGTSTSTIPSATRTTGPAFRSFLPTTSATRTFPRMSTVLAGATSWTWEVVPTVARTMNFRLTVRDNHISGPANNSDDVVITVNGTAGPFTVSAPNTAVSYAGSSSQTITWNVAGTTANGVNCANVDILLSTNGGATFTTVLAAATPNDGTQVVTIPNTPGTQNRIMVKGTNHIFFDVSNTNFTITAGSTDTTVPSAPLNLAAAGTTQTSTNLSWTASTDNVGVTGYDVLRNGVVIGSTTTATTFAVTGLVASTTYTFNVRAKDAAGNISANSNTVSVTTTAASDTTAPTAPTLSASGITQTATNLSWTGATDNVGVTGYDVLRNGVLIGSTTTATTFAVTGLTAATAYTFNVRAKDAAGNISANSNTVSVTTLSSSVTYCASQGNSTVDERIGRVVFGTINNPSTGTAGYENFTAISTNVVRGTANTITITPFWTGSVFSEGYRVFIDYNRDGDFADAGEIAFTRTATTATPITGTITIPATALLGSTRMRVSMKYNGTPTACEAFPYGQVEDYTINITASAARLTDDSAVVAIKGYPNPLREGNFYVEGVAADTMYQVVNTLGQQVLRGKFNGSYLDVTQLKAGTYVLVFETGNEPQILRMIKL